MPIYEYRCSSCGHELEALQKFSEPPLKTCPACTRDALVKLVSAGAFQLKGSGWYATDFKSNGKKAPAKPADGSSDAKSGEAKTSATGDTKSDSKSDTKSDSTSDTKSDSKGDAKPAAAASPASGAKCACD